VLEGRVGVLVEEDGPRGAVDFFALLEGKPLAGEPLHQTDAHVTLDARRRDPALEGAHADETDHQGLAPRRGEERVEPRVMCASSDYLRVARSAHLGEESVFGRRLREGD